MEYHSIATSAHTRFAVHAARKLPSPLVLVTHGYGGNCHAMMRMAIRFAPVSYSVISIQGPHAHTRVNRRTGTASAGYGWGTIAGMEDASIAHARVVRAVIDWAVHQRIVDGTPVALAGFSEPVELNYHYAATDGRVSGVLAFCGMVPEPAPAPLPAILHLVGAADPYYPLASVVPRLRALESTARSVQFEVTEAAHEITPEMSAAARRWLRRLASSSATRGRSRGVPGRPGPNRETAADRSRNT